jgi:hypothetical protein
VPLITTSNGIQEVPTPTPLVDVYLFGPSDDSSSLSLERSAAVAPLNPAPREEPKNSSPIASKVLRFIAEKCDTPTSLEVLFQTFGEVNTKMAITELLQYELISNDAIETWSYRATDRGNNQVKRDQDSVAPAGRS